MALGIAAIVVVWLVFSMLKKVLGLFVLIALAAGAWLVWSNPEMLGSIMQYLGIG